jgi:hypothetical protein
MMKSLSSNINFVSAMRAVEVNASERRAAACDAVTAPGAELKSNLRFFEARLWRASEFHPSFLGS